MSASTVIQSVYEDVLKRNPGEVEFHQAVKEVLDSLEGLEPSPYFAPRLKHLASRRERGRRVSRIVVGAAAAAAGI